MRRMKKALVLLTIIALAAGMCFGAGGDFAFLFTELDQHVEILNGFLPTLVTVGAGYRGLTLSEGDLTQINLTFGGGYTQRKSYQNPVDGSPLSGDFLVFDAIQTRWNLKMLQGLGESWVQGQDLVTLYAGYEGRWEKYVDSMVKTQLRHNGTADITHPAETTYPVPTLAGWQGGALAGTAILRELDADRTMTATTLYAGIILNGMEDTGVTSDGILGKFDLQWAPGGLSTDEISYFSATLNVVVSKTLWQKQAANGSNALSVVLIDRFNANWTDGSYVPLYAQGPVSLGRKVRGYNTYAFNTNFTVVNNLDLRISGPDRMLDFLSGVFPRLNLFVDCGWHTGRYFNSAIEGSHFLASTGAQLEMSFMDFIDLGIQVAWILSDTQNPVTPWSRMIMGATFFLDF